MIMTQFNRSLLPEKVYLSGEDCFHLVLDKHARKHGAGGNVMRKVLYFDRPLSFQKIDAILKSSPVIHWLCNIKLVYGRLFQLPYWKYLHSNKDIILSEVHAATENEIPLSISSRDIAIDSSRFIEADLVHYPSGKCAFIISWNHIVMDAKGTTLLFEHLEQLTNNAARTQDNFFPPKEKTASLFHQVSNMYKVKAFVQHSSRPPVSSVGAGKSINTDSSTATWNILLTESETKQVQQNAFKAGSRFGPTLFFVACCSHVVDTINKKRNNAGTIWLPVPYDGRKKGATGPMISNCVSFVFYRLHQNELASIPATVKCLNEQMKAQLKEQMPQRYNLFLDMMRRVPLWLYYLLISKTGKGVFASFLYTSTGDNFNELRSLFGETVTNITMVPALTFPPGLTFVFLKHDEALNINIAYSPKVISNNELILIEEKLREVLLTAY
jgi:hypothetical protein